MSVSGLCQVCEAAEATERCDNCGTLVCHEHFDRERRMCRSCTGQHGVGDTLQF